MKQFSFYLEGLVGEGLPIPEERAEQFAEKVILAVNLPSAA
jgi:hypothetical protein